MKLIGRYSMMHDGRLRVSCSLLWLGVLAALIGAGCRRPETVPQSAMRLKTVEPSTATEAGIEPSAPEVVSLKRDLARSQQRVSQLEGQLKRAMAQIEALGKNANDLRRSLAERTREASALRRQAEAAADARSKLETVSKQLEDLKSQFAAVRIEHQVEMARRDRIISKLNGKQDESGVAKDPRTLE